MVKPRKERVSVTLTAPYMDRLNDLVSRGLFVDRQEVIRASLRKLFEEYNPIPSAEEEDPGRI